MIALFLLLAASLLQALVRILALYLPCYFLVITAHGIHGLVALARG